MSKPSASREPRLDSVLSGSRKGHPLVTKVLGRPVKHDDKVTKVSSMLFLRQVGKLDEISTKIRMSSGRVIDRSDILRAVLDAVEPWKMDFSECITVDEVRDKVREVMRG